jgi:ubiquinone/menaquinone biosynthesis C-methylase UbiE
MSIWHAFGRQLQNPRGIAGHWTGKLMRWINSGPNHAAVEALQITPGDRVLELGFGPGHAIELIAARVTEGCVYGIDQSDMMLQQASMRNRRAIGRGRVVLRRAAFECLPFAAASIDKILAVNVVYFWRDASLVFQEIRRVLRPSGRIVIYSTDVSTMRGWKFAGTETHRLYDADALRNILLLGGFPADRISIGEISFSGGIVGLLAVADDQRPKG